MSKIKSNYEIISDKENNVPVTTTPYIQHDGKWLDEVISDSTNNYVTPEMFGAVGDGVADDTEAIVAAIANSKSTVYFGGKYKCTARIKITQSCNLIGRKNEAEITFVGCDGFAVNVDGVTFDGLRISGSNNHIGINYIENKISTELITNCTIRNFGIGVKLAKTWNFTMTKTSIVAYNQGLLVYGKSINNIVDDCRITSVDETATGIENTIGVYFSAEEDWNEGWMISNTLIYGFGTLIKAQKMSYVGLTNCILDHAKKRAISLEEVGGRPSGGWLISNNYIATDSAPSSCILIENYSTLTNSTSGNTIIGNRILDYTGGKSAIHIVNGSKHNVISNNTIRGFENAVNNLDDTTLIAGNVSSIVTNLEAYKGKFNSTSSAYVVDNIEAEGDKWLRLSTYCKVAKNGKTVNLMYDGSVSDVINPTSENEGYVVIGTLDKGYWPKIRVFGMAISENENKICPVRVTTTGEVGILCRETMNYVKFNLSYMIG